jgi:prolyl-tRNA editing enzyme YbaK/EbsC (Cys-tRNA(Pro) deacylase)
LNDHNLNELRELCNRYNVDYKIYNDHLPLKTAKVGANEYGVNLCETAPTLILDIDRSMSAAIIRGDTCISFNRLKKLLSAKRIQLAKASDVYEITNTCIGEISLINKHIKTFVDRKVLETPYVFGGCGTSNCTLKIRSNDLIRITNATVLDFTDYKSSS